MNSIKVSEEHIIYIDYIYIYIYLEPKWPIYEGQPPQNKAKIPIKTRVIWVPGVYL